jgi:RNA polymerase sigma-70 factor (ECF subfamily)
MAGALASSARPTGELDEVTLARARRGDEQARRELILHYKDRVFRVLWRMLACRGDGAMAEDLCQETFERVLRNLAGFSPSGAAQLSTWILTIATRLALKELRRRRVRETADRWLEPEPEPGPDRLSERAALGRAVRRAIARLSPDHRAVIILREYEELDYDAIARVLDIELGTVRSRLARARAELREALDGER